MGSAMSPLVTQALDLVLYGMGTVFVFLTVLVVMTMLMSLIVGASIGGAANEGALKEGIKNGNVETDALDPKLVAVIAAAVKRHRHSKQ